MADEIEVVIKMSKNDYDTVKEKIGTFYPSLAKAMKEGTILPENHGRLIDVDKIDAWQDIEYDGKEIRDLNEIPTVIGTACPVKKEIPINMNTVNRWALVDGSNLKERVQTENEIYGLHQKYVTEGIIKLDSTGFRFMTTFNIGDIDGKPLYYDFTFKTYNGAGSIYAVGVKALLEDLVNINFPEGGNPKNMCGSIYYLDEDLHRVPFTSYSAETNTRAEYNCLCNGNKYIPIYFMESWVSRDADIMLYKIIKALEDAGSDYAKIFKNDAGQNKEVFFDTIADSAYYTYNALYKAQKEDNNQFIKGMNTVVDNIHYEYLSGEKPYPTKEETAYHAGQLAAIWAYMAKLGIQPKRSLDSLVSQLQEELHGYPAEIYDKYKNMIKLASRILERDDIEIER